ncbi:MAG: Gfo/Idh/MocA family oxidoreductase [Clostridia bacterium]|nr:Gfo/Idh/MocA family oxidoreductase [Clostridia bacterium]
MSRCKIKIGIIGCGMIAEFHISALSALDDAEVIGVFDTSAERSRAFAQKHGIEVYETMDALLASAAEVVAICTPSGLHASLAIAALHAGKNVVVEKPVALTNEDCERILEAEKTSGKVCAVVSQLRYADGIRQAKEILDSGALGKPVLCDLYMKYYREKKYYEGSWRGTFAMDGGGALMNQGIHGIDVLRYLVGDVKIVNGKVRTLVHDIEVEDTAVASVQFVNGALGVIEGTTSVRPGYPRRIEIHCEKGSMLIEETEIVSVDLPDFDPNKEEKDPDFAGFKDPAAISAEGHLRQYKNILAAVRGEAELFYTAKEASETVKTILAIYESSKTDRDIHLN